MRVFKICTSEWVGASRDKRELSVCKELGADVVVMAKGNPGDKFKKDIVDGFSVYRFSTRSLGTNLPNAINRFAAIFTWAHYAKSFDADVISGHDLSGLLIGYMSNIFKPKAKKAKLVYDSHEFELGRNVKRNKFQLCLIKLLEGFLIKKCAFSIMVNDCIADEVQRIYKLKQRPIVVRNTPDYWQIDDDVTMEVHNEYCKEFNAPGSTFIAMYHGIVMRGRGIETLLRLTAVNHNICSVILGNGEEGYLRELMQLADELCVRHRILFKPAVPLDELWKYVGAANVGMILPPARAKSYFYSLPNKFFENIQSLTPIICSNYPAMQPIVEQYGIGLAVDISQESEIETAIERMRTDSDFYRKCKTNLKIAKEEFCWQKEKVALQQAYKGFMNN